MVLRLTPLSVQVRRSSEAVLCGEAILEFLNSKRASLEHTASRGRAPVTAVSADLQKRFPDAMKVIAVRQFVGLAVKSILQNHGFEVSQSGVRLPRDPVFSTASLYQKRPRSTSQPGEAQLEDLLGRLVEGLKPSERRTLILILRRSLGEAIND